MNIRKGEIIYIMGVSGVGKTTIGKILAERLELPYREADTFHPKVNIDKMKAGIPLNDKDRLPWLTKLNEEAQRLAHTSGGVISCSALKKSYRKILNKGINEVVQWVYLKGDFNSVLKQVQRRTGHYMPSTLLQSQFDILEEPQNAIVAHINASPAEVVEIIITALNEKII